MLLSSLVVFVLLGGGQYTQAQAVGAQEMCCNALHNGVCVAKTYENASVDVLPMWTKAQALGAQEGCRNALHKGVLLFFICARLQPADVPINTHSGAHSGAHTC